MFNDEVEIKLTLAEGLTKYPSDDQAIVLKYDKPKHVVKTVTFGDETADFDQLWADEKRTALGVTLNPVTELNLSYNVDSFISLIQIGFEKGESPIIGSIRNGRLL